MRDKSRHAKFQGPGPKDVDMTLDRDSAAVRSRRAEEEKERKKKKEILREKRKAALVRKAERGGSSPPTLTWFDSSLIDSATTVDP
jgi:hypothetical protein